METHAAAPLLTIAAAGARLRARTISSAELTDASLRAIDARNGDLRAFIRVDAREASDAARRLDDELKQGRDRGPLHGIPISLKDLIDVAGVPTTAASRALADAIARTDAPIVTRLREAGVVFLGKTNLHEFALGTTSEDSAYGAVRNPRDLTRSAGGSSGGSAVAVATGMGLGSVGSDTGGSIRIPAACCGIVGFKPAFGDVSTEGVVPLSTSLDHVGPLALTVQDAAWIWAALTGRPLETVVPANLSTLRLHHANGYFGVASSDVHAAFGAALAALTRAGAAIGTTTIEGTDTIVKAYVNIGLTEAAHWHARQLDARGDLYTPPVRARLEAGRAISAVDYLDARDAQAALRGTVDRALGDADALVLPTLPITAPTLGSTDAILGPGPGSTMPVRAAMLRNTQLFNLSGHPAISLPLRAAPLPVGLQLVGRMGDATRLLAIAAACEKIVCPAVE
jgi:aspartyl-tRNA(Asn)/glutamyl-tRNA(Gln) amidotransferase subunit A